MRHVLLLFICCCRRSWNEPSDPDGPDGANARFKKAVSLTGGELCRCVKKLATSWWPGRAIVAESLAKRKEDHPSGEVGFAVAEHAAAVLVFSFSTRIS